EKSPPHDPTVEGTGGRIRRTGRWLPGRGEVPTRRVERQTHRRIGSMPLECPSRDPGTRLPEPHVRVLPGRGHHPAVRGPGDAPHRVLVVGPGPDLGPGGRVPDLHRVVPPARGQPRPGDSQAVEVAPPNTHKLLGVQGITSLPRYVARRAFRIVHRREIANSQGVLWKSADDCQRVEKAATASPLSSSAQSSNHSVPVSVFDQSPTTGGQTVLDNSSVVHNALPKPPMIAPTRLGCLAGHSTCQNALRPELS